MASKLEWKEHFEDIFCSLPDEWDLAQKEVSSLVDIKLIARYGWKKFQDKATVKFQCLECDRSWTSIKGAVIFHYRLEGSDGRGEVKMWLLGQKCNKCQDKFEPANWYEEEIERVLENLFTKVREKFYIDPKPLHKDIDTSQRNANMKSEHRSELCEACARGVCGVRLDGGSSAASYSGASWYDEEYIYSDDEVENEEYDDDHDEYCYAEDDYGDEEYEEEY